MMRKFFMILCLSFMFLSGLISSADAHPVNAGFLFDGLDLDTGTVEYDRTILVVLMGATIEEILRPATDSLADFSPAVDLSFDFDPAEADVIDLLLLDGVKVAVLEDTSLDMVDDDMLKSLKFTGELSSIPITSDDLVVVRTTEHRYFLLSEFHWSGWTVELEVDDVTSRIIPEPSTLILLGLGLLLTIRVLKRKTHLKLLLLILLLLSIGWAEHVQAQTNQRITVKKEGAGTGTILIGGQECGPDCAEMSVPYVDHQALVLKVIPDEDSYFVRWETLDRDSSEGELLITSGETVIAVFDKKFGDIAVFDYDFWRETFDLPTSKLQRILVEKSFLTDDVIVPFSEGMVVYGVALDADIQFEHEASLVRVVLVDDQGNEYLLYEAYPLITPETSFSIKKTCEETCFVNAVTPDLIKIHVIDASITVHELLADDVPKNISADMVTTLKQQIKDAQNTVKIQRINAHIQKQGLLWIAGKTSVSHLSYQEKNGLFEGEYLPNLQGFDYYTGGIFEFQSSGNTSPSVTENSSSLVETFDWRDRHGENWVTPVKNQGGCGSCWAFAATGATEALVNLYFNQHLDLDLAEQDALSCSGAGSCGGGWPGSTLDYYTTIGVVDEGCFPYTASDEPCSNRCTNPDELIQISSKITFGSSGYPQTEDTLKEMIIEYGPVSGVIWSWNHAMTLVGYSKDANDKRTVWIFKNSWGTGWGENGYGNLKVEISDMGGETHALLPPIISAISRQISCVDKDSDGYCNWGISTDKPSSCPSSCKPEKDCDDSNAGLGPFNSGGECLLILDQNETGDLFGKAVVYGDFNKDGYMDLAVGASGESSDGNPQSGAVFVFKGDKEGMYPWMELDQQGLDVNEADDQFGTTLATGDFNKDGYVDLAVGALKEAPDGSSQSGAVFIFKGSQNGLQSWMKFDQQGLDSNEAGDSFSAALATGDFNKDGYMDLAVGAPGENSRSGYVFVFEGSSQGLRAWGKFGQSLWTNEVDDRFGSALASGDFNKDGFADLAIGAPGESPFDYPKSGFVFVFKGSTQGLEPWAGIGQDLWTNEDGDEFGTALASGDFNKDGYADLAIGAPGESPFNYPKSGFVFVFKGSQQGLEAWKGLGQESLDAYKVGDRFGAALAVGDFNNDNVEDLAIGAPGKNSNAGSAFVFRGSSTNLHPWIRLDQNLGASEAGDKFGAALAAGDFNGDGFADLAVGTPGEAPWDEPRSGVAFVFTGTANEMQAWNVTHQEMIGPR